MRGISVVATVFATLLSGTVLSPVAAQAACVSGTQYVDDVSEITYGCLGGVWEAIGDVPPAKVPLIVEAPTGFLPGRYSVPGEMTWGTWTARTREGAYPSCMYSTYTHDGILIDAYVGGFDGGPLVAELYSPAIATFRGSDNCTPWTKVS
ncbi:hypothetical protein [Mycobacterium sp. PSTR-4-N]|uniref:hypothetical protein n=1 Tax=Mycobacterium sp. PSTR-4-N TaxID=2917745 RepID=UPI001F155962|nr:hypothetical protein [Mycobacterium sp. PSTR-4-N]MCG7592449.1 hypothetical protein [Mycobacterium sp. PSTR-4-N]